MRRLTAFILILTVNCFQTIFACGPYYPFGEDVRFSLIHTGTFQTGGYDGFRYSANAFEADETAVRLGEDMNVALWRKRTGSTLSDEVIYNAIYRSENQFNGNFTNAFLLELSKKGDQTALDYLKFANRCSRLNSRLQNPWERREYTTLPARAELIREALEKAAASADKEIARRYAFLAIRLAHYNNDESTIHSAYKRYYADRKDRDILDYWALYFKALRETNAAKRNVQLALVFVNAPDKRFVVYQKYNSEIAIVESLQEAVTNEEKSALWVIDGITNPGRALENIRNVYSLTPGSPALSALLLREMNKLEDWIFTPYYSEFEPALSYLNEDPESEQPNSERINRDREYAFALLQLVKSSGKEQTADPGMWKIAQAYLQFMIMDYNSSLSLIRQLEMQRSTTPAFKSQLGILKALCLVSLQPAGNAIVPEEIRPILLQEAAAKNNRFLFAIARELEYKGNTTDAALILSNINHYSEESESVFWRTKQGYSTLYSDVYYDYFFYLDAAYSIDQLTQLIQAIQNANTVNPFDQWKFGKVKENLSRLYDLLGTKYIRKNQLTEALAAFEKADPSMWSSPDYPYAIYLNANPFYTNMYNEHTPVEEDSVSYTKPELVRTLLEYLKKAENPKTKNRHYYYFLVANCYLNMSYYGNSWMMRRYYASSYENYSGLEDDNEYYQCLQAEAYYLKAKQAAKNRQFQALCLRMAGRCEKYRILRKMEYGETYYDEEEMAAIAFQENKYWKQIRQEFPEAYDDLIYNCYSFDQYFQAHKKK